MKICPKCGHHEDMAWRARANRAFCSYVKWEQFKEMEPNAAQMLVDGYPKPVSDGHFMYKITKTGLNVERIEIELHKFMGFGAEPQEKKPDNETSWELAPIPGVKQPSVNPEAQTRWDEWIPVLKERGMVVENE